MNPFTKFLSQWSQDKRLHEFVAYWDALEVMVVQVYREKVTVTAAAAEFQRIWPWLRQHYGLWEAALRPYWQQTQTDGRPTQTDPFLLLLDIEKAADIPGNWQALQYLPAAREAINQLTMAQSD